ncbi:hypothetical protein HDV04_001727, partial [Boothiomyces sp. JEL0838]
MTEERIPLCDNCNTELEMDKQNKSDSSNEKSIKYMSEAKPILDLLKQTDSITIKETVITLPDPTVVKEQEREIKVKEVTTRENTVVIEIKKEESQEIDELGKYYEQFEGELVLPAKRGLETDDDDDFEDTKKLEKHHMKSFIGLLLVLVAGANPVQKDFESYHPAPVGHSYSHNDVMPGHEYDSHPQPEPVKKPKPESDYYHVPAVNSHVTYDEKPAGYRPPSDHEKDPESRYEYHSEPKPEYKPEYHSEPKPEYHSEPKPEYYPTPKPEP